VADDLSTLLLCARVKPVSQAKFGQWQASWQAAAIAAGAENVEFWPPAPPDQLEWVAVARFPSLSSLQTWRRGNENGKLVEQVRPLAEGGVVMQLAGQAAVDYSVKHGVTMVIVTEIKPGREADYRAWSERIQKLQAKFPGYIGSFVQPPQQKETGWTAVLRFDSAANLDRWLQSKERAAILKEGEEMIQGFHLQRVDTSFPGWVPNDPATGKPPNKWKTACLILLTLFPLVMLEIKFLNPHLRAFNPAVGTFFGNVITVVLTTWPLMPLAIWAFHAWLYPEKQPPWLVTAMPIVLVVAYLAEILLFWNLVP
jgi:uncharacterized protein